MSSTVRAAVAFNIVTGGNSRAHALDAAVAAHQVLNSVWIADEQAPVIHDLGAGVYRLQFRVEAPTHEVHPNAPIIARAMQATHYPADDLSVRVAGRLVTA